MSLLELLLSASDEGVNLTDLPQEVKVGLGLDEVHQFVVRVLDLGHFFLSHFDVSHQRLESPLLAGVFR